MKRTTRSALLCFGLAATAAARAGGWDVNPIRLDFDARSRTGAITIHNDGDAPLSFQMSLAEWSQDADGRDQYRDSRDLVYFPQIMTVEPQERRIIRVGTRLPPPERERSYRLFIEEMPEPDETRGKGTQVAVKLRFGVPLFVAPLEPQAAAVLERVELAHGELTVDVRNGGNRHVKVDGISVSANGSVIGETTGWYVLPGVVRSFTLPLPAEACAAAGTIELLVAGSPQLQLQRTLDVAPDRCR